MTPPVLRLATPGSVQGIWRAQHLAALLRALPLAETGDIRLVPCEPGPGALGRVREAVLNGKADVAVHAADELPWAEHERLRMVAIPSRGDARDALCTNLGSHSKLPPGALVGARGPRVRLQLGRLHPAVVVVALDEGVASALGRLEEDLDGIVAPLEDLVLLEQQERVTETFSLLQVVPAAGQAALALEVRADDRETGSRLAPLNHAASRLCVLTERTVARRLSAWPGLQVGTTCALDFGFVAITAVLAPTLAGPLLRVFRSGPVANARQIAEAVADELVLLQETYAADDASPPADQGDPARGLLPG